jgi:hypothetical protein
VIALFRFANDARGSSICRRPFASRIVMKLLLKRDDIAGLKVRTRAKTPELRRQA